MIRKFGSNFKIAKSSTVAEEVMRDGQDEKPNVIEAKNPDFLYFRARAISAGDQGPVSGEPNPNGNGDYFPRQELEASYKTFENRNLFLNHESDHPIKSIGKVISAEPIEDPETGEFYIETLAKIDRKLHPELARKIETGELNTVSMGCSCEESQCSVCGTKIFSDEDTPCQHLSSGIGKVYTAEADNEELGIRKGQPIQAFSINRGLNFNELSIVHVPADESAMIKTVLANVKRSLSKKAASTEEKKSVITQLKDILSQLESEENKKEVKDQICAYEVSKEDSKMAEKKATSKSEDINKKPYELSEDDHVNMILDQKLSALDYTRLLNSIEKKQKKAEQKKEEKVEVEAKKEPDLDKNFVEKVADAVKNFISSKKEDKKADIEKEKAAKDNNTEEVKKEADIKVVAKYDDKSRTWAIYDDGVRLMEANLDDLWDAEQLKDDEFVKNVTSDDYAKALVARYQEEGPDKIAKLLGIEHKAMDKEADAEKEYEKSKKAINKEDETDVGEHLEKHEEAVKDKKASDKEAKKPEVKPWMKDDGESDEEAEAVAEDEERRKKEDKKEAKEESKQTKKSDKNCPNCDKHLNDCVCDKSQTKDDPKKHSVEAYDKANKNCPNCNKHLDDCVCDPKQTEDDAKKHSVEASEKKADLPVEEETPAEEEPKPEDAPEERPEEEVAPEVKMPEEKEESAFDKLDEPIIIGEGYTAEKDKETGEIILKQDGEEQKRLPDAFGDDVASIMKFFQADLGIQHEEHAPNKVEEPAVQHVEHDEEKPKDVPEEKPEEEHLDETSAYAAKKAEIEKKAAELKKKEEEIQKKEAEFKKKAEQEKAQVFASSVRSRQEKAKSIVHAMVDKDLLKLDQNTIDARLKEGDTVLDARHYALREAVDKQIRDLLAMDEISLKAFEKTISNVEIKKQANRLTSPLSIDMPDRPGTDSELDDIFNSMGNGGGSSVFRS